MSRRKTCRAESPGAPKLRCTKARNHDLIEIDVVHKNGALVWRDDEPKQQPMRCPSISQGGWGKHRCLKLAGHGGEHNNGGLYWGEDQLKQSGSQHAEAINLAPYVSRLDLGLSPRTTLDSPTTISWTSNFEATTSDFEPTQPPLPLLKIKQIEVEASGGDRIDSVVTAVPDGGNHLGLQVGRTYELREVGTPAQEARRRGRDRAEVPGYAWALLDSLLYGTPIDFTDVEVPEAIRDRLASAAKSGRLKQETAEERFSEPAPSTPEEHLRDWWFEQAQIEIDRTVPKAVEYSATDLADIGYDMARVMKIDRDMTDEEAAELGVFFYLRGKVARWVGAVQNGQRVSDDTLFDIGVYVRMAQRIRATGGWPGVGE